MYMCIGLDIGKGHEGRKDGAREGRSKVGRRWAVSSFSQVGKQVCKQETGKKEHRQVDRKIGR